MFYKIFSLLLIVSSLSGAELATMSEAEQKACGLDKLSLEEKAALNSWVAKQLPPATPPVKKGKIEYGEFLITSNEKMGRFIILENGITYDIPSRSRKKTMGWKAGDKVTLVETVREPHFKLENIVQKQKIGAKRAKDKLKSE